jgi:hypothetical protein
LVRHLLRSNLCLFAVALGLLVQPLHAQAQYGVPVNGGVPVKTYTGYFNNTAVFFTAFETNSPSFAQANQLVSAPRLSLLNRQVLPHMIFFPNVGFPQSVVLQTEPGFSNYAPIWHVLTAFWRGTGPMPLIASYAAAVQWNRLGKLAVFSTGILFNGPVIWVNMNLNRQGGQPAPTLPQGELLALNPSTRTAVFQSHPGYYAGQSIAFLALEHAPGVAAFAPGAMLVPLIGLNFQGHNGLANFYMVQGQQLPVIDSFPAGNVTVSPTTPVTVTPPTTPTTGIYSIAGAKKPVPLPQGTGQTGQQPVAGQTGQQPVAGQTGQQPVSGNTGQAGQQPVTYTPPVSPASGQPSYASLYSPLWHVHQVMFRPGVVPQLLTSVQAIQQAQALGLVTVTPGNVDAVFNCPVVTAPQPVTSPTTGGNPVYNPNPTTGGTPVYNPTMPVGGTPVTPTSPY